MAAETRFPIMVAKSTRLRPYLSLTARISLDPSRRSCRLTATEPRADDALAQAEQAAHSSAKKDDVPVLPARSGVALSVTRHKPRLFTRSSPPWVPV